MSKEENKQAKSGADKNEPGEEKSSIYEEYMKLLAGQRISSRRS